MPIPESEPLTPEIAPVPEVEIIQPKKKSLVTSILLGLVIILLLSTAAFAALYLNIVKMPAFLTSAPAAPAPSAQPTTLPSPSTTPTVTDGITWLSKPEAIASIQLTKPQEEIAADYNYYLTNKTEYTVVGVMEDGRKIVSMSIPCEGMMCDLIVYCLVSETKSECLTSGLNEYDLKTVPQLLMRDVSFKNSEVKGITAPSKLTVKGVTLHLGNRYSGKLTDIDKTELYEETTYGALYRGFSPLMDSTDLVARNFYLMLGDGSLFTYSYTNKPYNAASGSGFVPVWINGVDAPESMTQSLASGCGSSMWGSVPVYRGNLTKTVAVAKAINGDTLYQSESSTDGSLQFSLYQFYKQGRSETDPNLLTSEQFLAKKDVYVLWKDTLGDWQVFMSDAYAPMAECGKPVIYLYPTQTTPVSVQVGALIRISEPEYSINGWRVVAEPSGAILYQQRIFPYLFWEGKGMGAYPDYRDRGIVVTQNQLLPTLYQQMTDLGLNTKEQADFIEFWQPRLPSDPYVRLTWLGTQEMNILAPLSVLPKPDTTIRVFLEFEGMKQPRTIQPQYLSAPTRTGFTLVEWGGLLVGGAE